MSAPEPPKRMPGGAFRWAGLGLELAATLVGACLLGYWIDRQLKTDPWALLICAVLGIVGGLYNMIRRSVHDLLGPTGKDDKRRGQGTGGDASV
ncbi:MAG: AtpZ/AtpI family protein [Phycisphaerae bacterium]|nr:AtpZ/AtpI family protein [Phycisphaerae bacterium]